MKLLQFESILLHKPSGHLIYIYIFFIFFGGGGVDEIPYMDSQLQLRP